MSLICDDKNLQMLPWNMENYLEPYRTIIHRNFKGSSDQKGNR